MINKDKVSMDKEGFLARINLDLPLTEFRRNVEELIKNAELKDKNMPLPFPTLSVEVARAYTVFILSQINCEQCNARCCKSQPDVIAVNPKEYKVICDKYLKGQVLKNVETMENGFIGIHYPCPFLHGKQCTIYVDRPLVCMTYPISPKGGHDEEGNILLSLSPGCPEAKKLLRKLWIMTWKLYQKGKVLSA